MRGEGDALAAKIYSDSYTVKMLSSIVSIVALKLMKIVLIVKSDIMVVKPDSDFFHYLKDGSKTKK